MSKKIILRIAAIGMIFALGFAVVFADYIPNSRDTKESPEELVYTIEEPETMQLLHENDNFKFYFRDERDVLAIYDKRNDFTYKTGMDVPFGDETEEACEELIDSGTYTQQELDDTCVPIHDLSNTAREYVNSFLTLEYLEEVGTRVSRLYSAADDYESSLSQVAGGDDHWVFDVNYLEYGVEVRVHFHFDDSGVRFEIRDEEVNAIEPEKLLHIAIAPFMGAQGGYMVPFDQTALEYDDDQAYRNVINPGYSFIPDGSGALLRYEDTDIDVGNYLGDVYGEDVTTYRNYIKPPLEYLDAKPATLPVYGMTYGDDTEAAFVAYASSGDEYMQVVSAPLTGILGYVQTYSQFVYSSVYRQVFNTEGDGYDRLPKDRNHFDVNLHVEFLEGDGSTNGKPASYVGMAKTYRDFLIESDLLTPLDTALTDIPLRVDFFMADSKTGIFGYEEQVATTMEDVGRMLNILAEDGVKNINGGLLGWQDGGMLLSSPKNMDFTNSIGSKSDFERLVEDALELGFDISLSQDFITINEDMIRLRGNAVKHINGKYYEIQLGNYQTIMTEHFAKPDHAMDWLYDHANDNSNFGTTSLSVYGISNNLYSDTYEELAVSDVKNLYKEGFSNINEDYNIAANKPHVFLMNAIDRYLNTPVYSSQYIIASDTVPFLQLVLANTVELYAPYANFSFSGELDMLRMIDYNVYPSFVLTEQPSYVLAKTNSNEYISTQFTDYEDLIVRMYNHINDALSPVIGQTWMNREVLEAGVIANTYENGTIIIINYTEDSFVYNGDTVQPTSYLVVED